MRVFGRTACAALILALGLVGEPVEAGNLDEFGYGARPTALGGAFTAYASGPEAAYYNPGGLILSKSFNLLTGYAFADYQLDFSSANGVLDDDAERLDDLSVLQVGFSTTIPFLGEPDRFALGLAIALPTRDVTTVSSRAPSSTPEFAQYDDRHDRLQAYVSGAVKATEWLYFGLGVQIFADAEGRADVDTIGGIGASEFELELAGDLAPVFGIYAWPIDNLSIGFTFRGEISLKLDFDVTAFGAIPAAVLEAITLFSPDQFALGVAYNPTDYLFLLFDITYFRWSALNDPFLTNNGNQEQLEFDDTIVPRFGVEFFPTEDRSLAIRAGYFYRPSPVPEQDGNRNLIDSPKHVFSAGVGYTFVFESVFYKVKPELKERAEEAERDPARTTINLMFQLHWHQNDRVTKDIVVDPLDPVGQSFKTGGTIINVGLELVTKF